MKRQHHRSTDANQPHLFESRPSSAGGSETISFRLPDDVMGILAERAAIHELSIHRYARMLVLEALFQSDAHERIGAAIADSQREVHQLRHDLAFSMKTLLMTAGKLSEEAAREWVQRNFKL